MQFKFVNKILFIVTSCLLYFVLSNYSAAQSIDSLKSINIYPFVVDSIKITGNEITEDFIILRELNFSVGDTLTSEAVSFNRERVYSLGIFNHVYLIPTIIDSSRILNISLEEGWYIYPLPFVNIKDNDFDKISYGISLRINNFRGRNETLIGSFALGYDPTLFLSYYNPNIIGNENFFVRSQIGFTDVTNRSDIAEELYGESFSQKNIGGFIQIGKRLGLFQRVSTSLGFNYIETPKYVEGINASNSRIDRLPQLGFIYEYDTRDLVQFARRGFYTNANFYFKGLGTNDISYRTLNLDYRHYINLTGNLFAKWRLASRFTFGDLVPYYDYSIIGLNERIRGRYNEKYEGNNLYFASAELYYPIIEELNIDIHFIPFLPKQLFSYRIAFYAQLFADAGATQFTGEPINLKSFKNGYGGGFSFILLPYTVFRLELGFNEFGKQELIFAFGTSF